jgi:hypothetical protein
MKTHIEESELYFGDYETEDFFHIEKAEIYRKLGNDVKTVEFALRKNGNEVLFVEAKMSSPRPDNNEDFDKFIQEIAEKFSHSNELFFSVITKRLSDLNSEMPDNFKTIDYSGARIKVVLIINGHPIEWLSPISNALTNQLRRQIKMWGLEIAVLNDKQAIDYKLVKP